MWKTLGIVAALALPGCPLQTQKSMTLGSGETSPPSANAQTPAGEPVEQGQSNLNASNFLRAEFESLRGLPLDKAKAQAKQAGHTGEVRVEELNQFVEGCADGTVCTATDERGGQSGMNNADVLLLRVQKSRSIALPPE